MLERVAQAIADAQAQGFSSPQALAKVAVATIMVADVGREGPILAAAADLCFIDLEPEEAVNLFNEMTSALANAAEQ